MSIKRSGEVAKAASHRVKKVKPAYIERSNDVKKLLGVLYHLSLSVSKTLKLVHKYKT